MSAAAYFVASVRRLAEALQLRDDQTASALTGIVVAICAERGDDPYDLIDWALDVAKRQGDAAPPRSGHDD